MSRSSRGRAFHNFGAATWKDLSPSVSSVLNVGDARKIWPDDLRLYAPCDFQETKFWMYVGSMAWVALNANNKILKWMRCFNGSQCSSCLNNNKVKLLRKSVPQAYSTEHKWLLSVWLFNSVQLQISFAQFLVSLTWTALNLKNFSAM